LQVNLYLDDSFIKAKMKNGLSRFNFHLRQLQNLLDKAREQKDPAGWLFINNGRTSFFMLQGLSRAYAAMHDRKKFSALKDKFKRMEDRLGEVDYYNSLHEVLSSNKKIPEQYTRLALHKLEGSKEKLQKTLFREGWISPGNAAMKKISGKLKKARWMKAEKEVKALSDYYLKSVEKIKDFAAGTGYQFDNVEEDIHELRRKLRWLSIYPQAMQGIFQYRVSTRVPAHLKKYITPEIEDSPFNKMTEPGTNTSFIMLDRNRFLALSWMIAKLGELKDEGLLVTGLAELIVESSGSGKNKAFMEACRLMAVRKERMPEILKEAESLTRGFMNEKIPDNLYTGIATPGRTGKQAEEPVKKTPAVTR
jgi:hypothetical protein